MHPTAEPFAQENDRNVQNDSQNGLYQTAQSIFVISETADGTKNSPEANNWCDKYRQHSYISCKGHEMFSCKCGSDIKNHAAPEHDHDWGNKSQYDTD